MFIVLIGIQGSGKGTQAPVLSKKLGIPHITSGGIFTELEKQDSPLADKVRNFKSAGLLVDDPTTIDVIRERFSKSDVLGGAIIDGFPRNEIQAKALEEILAPLGGINIVLFLNLEEQVALARVETRLICTNDSTHVYNRETHPPKIEGMCDFCHAPLKVRTDDNERAKIEQRFKDFREYTRPLVDFYHSLGVLQSIDASQSIEEVSEQLFSVLSAYANSKKKGA